MLSLAALLFFVSICSAGFSPLNETVEIDLVFPLNGTYELVEPFPIIFIIPDATAIWDYGFTFSWYINGRGPVSTAASGIVEVASSGNGAKAAPYPLPSNPYIIVNSTWQTLPPSEVKFPAGEWTLYWSLYSPDCTPDGSSGNWEFFNIGGETVAEGNINFTTVDDGSGAPIDFTSHCPQVAVQMPYIGNYTVCPEIGDQSSVGPANPCAGKLDAAQASSISSALAWSTASPTPSSTGSGSAATQTGSSSSGSSTNEGSATTSSAKSNMAANEQSGIGMAAAFAFGLAAALI